MNKKIKEVMAYGTILNDISSNFNKEGYFVRVTSYLYGNTVYYITRVNGEVVDFTDTSKVK